MSSTKTAPTPKPVAKTAVKTAAKSTVEPAAKPAVTSAAKTPAQAASKPEGSKPDSVKGALKLVRDSFTIPKAEYLVLQQLKDRAARLARPTKKSELLRAGIAALHGMSDKALLLQLAAVQSLKTGRPKGPESAKKPAKKAA
jgi:hypothetical protein